VTLRARLLLAFGYLVTLVLVVAASGTFGFLHLASGIDQVLTENFRTIQAAMQMTSTLERLDTATFAALLPDGASPERDADLETSFLRALTEAESNVTEPGEPQALASIRSGFEAYRSARTDFLASAAQDPSVAAYERDLAPLKQRVEESIAALREINQRAMFRAEEAAQRTAVRSATALGSLVVLSLLSFVLMSNALHRNILDRLDDLRSGVSMLGSGDRVRRLREHRGDDEFAVIARQINRLIDREQQAESRAHGRLARERRLTLGLLARCGEGAALFGGDGYLLAGSMADASLHDAVRERVRALSEAASGEAEVVTSRDGARARLEPLAAGSGVVAAWLVTPDPSA
jgi:GGDEF domain-containing protein